MKVKSFLISAVLVLCSTVNAQEVSFKDTVIQQTTQIVESTVNMIAHPFLSEKDIDCLARNIFYESRGENEEGKIAVGMVTINRAKDTRFGRSVCEVVKSRTVTVRTREVTKTEIVKTGHFGRPEEVTKKVEVIEQVPVCQFSWYCAFVRKPSANDENWIKSQEIARNIASGEYENYREKYRNALYFHSAGIRPMWAKGRPYITRTGGHIFYE